jgi:hypothetical protein
VSVREVVSVAVVVVVSAGDSLSDEDGVPQAASSRHTAGSSILKNRFIGFSFTGYAAPQNGAAYQNYLTIGSPYSSVVGEVVMTSSVSNSMISS